MVSDIPYAVMKKIRRALNVKSTLDNDFRALAGELGMETSDVRLLSQTKISDSQRIPRDTDANATT